MSAAAPTAAAGETLAAIDWAGVTAALDARGHARLPQLLDAAECAELAGAFDDDARFRATIDMARHGFGQGCYRYFAHPLPPRVEALRRAFYPPLAAHANTWAERLRRDERYPADLDAYLARCHRAGQTRPTPLLLRYGAGDYNCLHQDRYGEELFPLQVAVLLSAPGRDFDGGEFVLTEQRPRRQSRATVVPLEQGDAVVFAVAERPVRGTRGDYRVNTRHGVSELHRGQRLTLGLIFHDAG